MHLVQYIDLFAGFAIHVYLIVYNNYLSSKYDLSNFCKREGYGTRDNPLVASTIDYTTEIACDIQQGSKNVE